MPKLSFYPLDITYKVEEGKPIIYLFGKSEERHICIIDNSFRPYFYIIAKEGVDPKESVLNLKVDAKDRIAQVVELEPNDDDVGFRQRETEWPKPISRFS